MLFCHLTPNAPDFNKGLGAFQVDALKVIAKRREENGVVYRRMCCHHVQPLKRDGVLTGRTVRDLWEDISEIIRTCAGRDYVQRVERQEDRKLGPGGH